MADTSATIIAASLSSEELEKSIYKLVDNVATATSLIRKDFDDTASYIKKSLSSIGDIKINLGGSGSANGGSLKQVEQEAKSATVSLDNFAKAQQVAIRSANPSGMRNAEELQTMNIQLDLLRERLREARNQYSSFIALASHATTTGDKGLYQFATENVHRYEEEVRNLIPQIRGMQSAIAQFGDVIAPQGHTIQNYVNSLQKANPELAALNGQFKRGKSLLQQQETEFEKNAQAQRNLNSATNQQKKTLDEMNAYVRLNTQREQERRNAILQTGIAARETANQLIKSAHEQASAQSNTPITGAKELAAAVEQMRRAYFDLSSSERISPIGRALEEDIKRANDAITVIKKYNQSLIGSQHEERYNITNASTLDSLRQSLKGLTDQYNKLTVAELNAGKGDALIQHFQDTTRAAQILQKTLNRPVSLKAALTGDERTLDDIAYKMQRLRAYKQGIDLTKPNSANEIKQVDEALVRLQKDMDKYLSKSRDVLNSNNALGRSWNYMKNRLAFYFTVGASTQFIKNLIEVRSQYEMNERALGILINSAERGTQIFNELSQMALVSPYTLIELSAAAKQLTAYDIAARDVVDTTRRLADMASAVGVPIERLTYALGQIKAYGYLNSRDARMFANAGIPLVKQLSDYYTELEGKVVSTADVYDRMKKKAIDYNSVMAVVTKMTDEGGKFFDFQAKMADTLKVRLANLTLAWNNMLNDMGKETQGVLTWSIGALRNLFLQWKNIYGALNEVAFVLGVAKALQFLGVCAHAAGVGFGSLNKYMTLNALLGTKLATTVRTLGSTFMSLVHSPLAWFTMAALLVTEIGDAFINADRATKEFNKSLRDGAKTTYEDLKKFAEQYKNVRDSLYTTQKTAIGNIYDPSIGKAAATAYANQTVGQDISASEAKKVWEAMREQIELSSHASDEYISKLLSIENVSERLRQGFQILDDIQTVSAALKEIGEDGIKVTQGWAAWWNAWQGADGLIGNIKDLQKEIQRLKDAGQDPDDKFTKVIDKDYATALERFRNDLKVTTDSVLDFINLNGWSGDTGKIDEVFKQVTDKLATQGNLDPQTAFTLQKDVEIARAKAAKEALEIRIADEKNALATASDEISKQQIQKNLETLEQQKRDFDKFNGENRAYWNDFTKYIKERHISELTAAYNSMTDHGKKAMDFQSEEWQKHVHDWANRYEKSHNLATDSVFNRLRNWINDANTWSVFIKMTISTEDGKSVYKQLEEYDKAADDAWKTMQRLDKRISQLRKKGAKEVEGAETGAIDLSRVSQDDRELTEALKERTQAQKDYNDAVEKGGESKKENAAASKAQKAAESELAKALKDELKLIETVRSSYKDLTKEGASHTDAIEKSVSGYEKSVANINKVLEKYGVKLDLTKFAGIANPHELQEMFKQQLNALAGKAKPTEIQALEVELQKVDLDVEKYDLTKITKGLNNELDRLKDEYELAVSLDADPELGNMFADWMGIDVSDLPRTASEYAERASKILNSKLKDLGAKTELPNVLDITDDDMRAFEENKVFTDKQLELVKKAVEAARGFQRKETEERIKDWDKLLEKYAEYETKINRIQNDAVKERVTFAQQFGNQEEKDLAIKLQTQILAATDPQEKQKLIEQLKNLVKSIAGDDKTKLNIATSIENFEQQETAKASFEEFQKTPTWLVATGDLAGMTNKAIGGLIKSLEKYKKTWKGLDDKQIKRINSALKTLYKEQRKNNPFGAISNMIDEAKERLATVQPELDSIKAKMENVKKEIGDKKPTKEQIKTLKELREQWEKLSEVGKISAAEWVNSIMSVYGAIKGAIGLVDELAKAIGGKEGSDIEKVFGVIDKAGQGAQIGASFGTYGAVIGAIAGAAVGFIKLLNGDNGITNAIKHSEVYLKRLQNTYNELERDIEKSYGTEALGAQKLQIANKQAQLEETKRQLELERSRKKKNQDLEKIAELENQVSELEDEISTATKKIVEDLMGIGNATDFAENLVSSMIDAFKRGEDYMGTYSDAFDEMIDAMIAKAIVGRLIGQKIEELFTAVQNTALERAENDVDVINAEQRLNELQEKVKFFQMLHDEDSVGMSESEYQSVLAEGRKQIEEAKKEYEKLYSQAATPTPEDVDMVRNLSGDWSAGVKEMFDEYMKAFGIAFGQDAEKNQLSALQQGIQGITETTAGALEAYMNSVSQQVYYQSDLLTQIRDAVVLFNTDVQVATMGQILLQLQNSYLVQTAIQNILNGWSSPNGLAVRVEMA